MNNSNEQFSVNFKLALWNLNCPHICTISTLKRFIVMQNKATCRKNG